VAPFLLALALAAASGQDNLDRLAEVLRSAPAWSASFTQVYTPEGFTEGTTEHGTLTLAPPARLRFDYTTASPRAFATDGRVARLVDAAAGSCDAVRLDAGTWGRLPLAALLDPPAARAAFAVESRDATLRLVPRKPAPDLAEITVRLDARGLPDEVTVLDGSGTRNTFTFSGWHAVAEPPPSFFLPALPGKAPCTPEESDTGAGNR
jgi:outer membrane lipoprotein-sorting protein